MDGLIVPIVVAATVATFVWGLVGVMTSSTRGDKRKLHERLSSRGRGLGGYGSSGDGVSGAAATGAAATGAAATGAAATGAMGKSILVQLQVKGVPAVLARQPFIQK